MKPGGQKKAHVKTVEAAVHDSAGAQLHSSRYACEIVGIALSLKDDKKPDACRLNVSVTAVLR